jgi:hypothetical protein
MTITEERRCVGCGDNEDPARLEICVICQRPFCTDCVHRAIGRRFCSAACAKEYFYGDSDDDEDHHDDAG